jgi:hypothetical protein
MRKGEIVRDLLSLYWRYYASAAVVAGVALGFFAFAFHVVALRNRDQAEMRNWPVIMAQVVESDIREVPSGKYSQSTRVVILLKLRYEIAGRIYVERYTRTWPRDDRIDCASSLAVGKSIEIRYSPSDPREVSLYPITPY